MEYNLLPFEVKVLRPERTICEKIMSLVRFSYGENPLEDLSKKIRHTYDLHKLLEDPKLKIFFDSNDFETLFLGVAQDDVKSFKNNKQWLDRHPTDSLIFRELDQVWLQLKKTYLSDFSNLVYGDLPLESNVLETLQMIKERLNTVIWSIDLEN